jgi:hypothetical protein
MRGRQSDDSWRLKEPMRLEGFPCDSFSFCLPFKGNEAYEMSSARVLSESNAVFTGLARSNIGMNP